jgi:hypothetical protein
MKTKHIFLPIYLIAMGLSITQLYFRYDETKLNVLDLLAIFFLMISLTVVALFLLERIYTNWNNKI